MKVSFLIPSKNRLDLLRYCVHSIRQQTTDCEIEIIISDNASSEEYGSYVEGLSDSRVIYLRQPDPLAVTDNWCAALSRATGDYVLMLGDDDAIAPDFFATLRPFLTSDGPDVIYQASYHYCYPNVMPGNEPGSLVAVGCEFLPNENGPFCLLRNYAEELAVSVLGFRHRFGLNAQHFLLKRSFIDRIGDIGPLYQSPYPDFFAAIVAFVRAKEIVVVPKPSVIIGISPKSFGAYYFSSRQEEGYEFLANAHIDAGIIRSVRDVALPGDENNTKWLAAAEMAKRAISGECSVAVDQDRYAVIQIASIFRHRYVDGKASESAIAAVRSKLKGKELLLLDSLRAALDAISASASSMLPGVVAALERQIGQYSPPPARQIDIGAHSNIIDAFNYLASVHSEPAEGASTAVLPKSTPVGGSAVGQSPAHKPPKPSLTRRLARAFAIRLLILAQRLCERIDRAGSEGVSAKRDPQRLSVRTPPTSAVQASALRIAIRRGRKKIVIAPDEFDDFAFEHGDELRVVPPSKAAVLHRTPDQHVHISLGDGCAIRVPPKMLFAPYKGFSVPEHLVSLTGAGVETLDELGRNHIASYAKHMGINPGMSFLEIGSGIGRDAFQWLDYLSPCGSYWGIDVQRESIAWCQKNITAKNPNVRFHHFNAFHELHNPLATKKTMDFGLPVPNRSIDRIALGSVLTHIFRDEIIHYMREIARVLKSDGLVYATFFLYTTEAVLASRRNNVTQYNLRFEHAYGNGCYVNDPRYPSGAVAYTDDAMQSMIAEAGLKLARPYLKGLWSGHYPDGEDGQDVAILCIK